MNNRILRVEGASERPFRVLLRDVQRPITASLTLGGFGVRITIYQSERTIVEDMNIAGRQPD